MSTVRPSYGFSALFEAMEANTRREDAENTIMEFASGAMEASLLGDDVVSALGASDDIPTGDDDFDHLDESDIENDEDLKKLDNALDEMVKDEETISVEESMNILNDALESVIESDIYGGY